MVGVEACQDLQKERYVKKEDTSIVQFEDPLTEIAREGARRMLATAVEAEIEVVLGQFAEEQLPDGRLRIGTDTARSARSRPGLAASDQASEGPGPRCGRGEGREGPVRIEDHVLAAMAPVMAGARRRARTGGAFGGSLSPPQPITTWST